jgi:hypothetical protein
MHVSDLLAMDGNLSLHTSLRIHKSQETKRHREKLPPEILDRRVSPAIASENKSFSSFFNTRVSV